MYQLEIEGLAKSFGREKVLEDVSLQVESGEFFIILGPSGCGKSTLLRLVAGLDDPDRGVIRIAGREVGNLTPRERDVAMVFQSYALYPHLTVRENLGFGLKARGTPRREMAEMVAQAAAMLGLEKLLDRRPAQLSGGQRQRVAIGRAIVRRPNLFLMDEPLSNLDAGLRAEMRLELIRLHRRLEATVVYVTHDQVEAMTLGRRIMILHRGRVRQTGPPREVYERPADLFVAGFLGHPPMNLWPGRVEAGERGPVFRPAGTGVSLPLPPEAASLAGREITLGLRPEAVTPGPGPLKARLEMAEVIGGDAVLHLTLDGLKLTARAPAGPGLEPGEILDLTAPPEAMHFFDEKGRRMEIKLG